MTNVRTRDDRRPWPAAAGAALGSPAKAHTRLPNAASRFASTPVPPSHPSIFSAVYYTKVTLEPGTGIPKTKVFLCTQVEKGCLPGARALRSNEEAKFNLLPLRLSRISAPFVLYFVSLVVFSPVVLTGIERRETLTLSKLLLFGEITLQWKSGRVFFPLVDK